MAQLGSRLEKLREKLDEKELDAIFISQPENRFYLSGFDGSAGYLLVSPQDATLATDFRYVEQAKTQAPDYQIFQVTGKRSEWFPKLLGELNMGKLGFTILRNRVHVCWNHHRKRFTVSTGIKIM